jgi:hypothetical protein
VNVFVKVQRLQERADTSLSDRLAIYKIGAGEGRQGRRQRRAATFNDPSTRAYRWIDIHRNQRTEGNCSTADESSTSSGQTTLTRWEDNNF